MEQSILKIKPYNIPELSKYPYANGISWVCNGLFRYCPECWLNCDLVYVWDENYIDENTGEVKTITMISESLKHFDMIVPDTILDTWGPDVVIDDYVLTYDPNFERE